MDHSAEFANSILNSVSAHIAVIDRAGEIVAVNDAWTTFARRNGDPGSASAGVGANYLSACRKAEQRGDTSVTDIRLGIESVMQGERSRYFCEYPCHSPTEQRWFLMNASRMADADYVVVAHENITERKLVENQLQASHDQLDRRVRERTRELESINEQLRKEIAQRERTQQQLRQAAKVFDSAIEAILIADSEQKIVTVNRAFTRITGYEPEEVLGRNPRLLSSARQDREFYQVFWQSLNRSGRWQGEIWNRRKNGEIYPAWQSVSVTRDAEGEVLDYISVFSDIGAIKQAEERLSHLAHHDALTGLANRLLFSARLEQALERARRHGINVGLLFIDMDRFKFVNDSLGHPIGDLYLKATAERLAATVRAEDTVARLGGDEFAVLVEDLTHAEDAGMLAGKIVELLHQPVYVAGHEVASSGSIGISIYPEDAEDGAELLKAADAAMYMAKEEGRNTARFYQPQMRARAFERMTIENGLRRAIQQDELTLHYQPLVDLSTRRCVGLEALLRWHLPERGIVMPGEFIPVAEETRLIQPIGRWVFRRALRDLTTWRDQGLGPLRLAVNVSWRQFNHDDFSQQLVNVLEEHGLKARDIELDLEVTESTLQGSARAVEELLALREQGMRVMIDDFGTGYSSLSQLMNMPVDGLKIDRMFLHDVEDDERSRAIIRSLIELANGLGLDVVGEGVETEAQLAFLRSEGCRLAQGFLLGRPVPAERVPELFGQALRCEA